MANVLDTPSRKTAGEIREELQKLRGMLEDGDIDNAQYAARSARLLAEIKALDVSKHRYAKS